MKEKFLAFSRLKQVTIIVIAVHFSLICVLSIHHLFSREKPKPKIVVRTIHPKIKTVAQIAAKAPVSVKSVKPKASHPKPSAPKIKEKALAAAPRKTAASNGAIVELIESSLADLEKKSSPSPKASLVLPKELPKMVSEEIIADGSYGEILVDFLQNSLELPEVGEVKVDLELNHLGRLVRFEVIEAKSKKNGEFLKKRLPELVLPCNNCDRKPDEIFKFTITFKNMDVASACSF